MGPPEMRGHASVGGREPAVPPGAEEELVGWEVPDETRREVLRVLARKFGRIPDVPAVRERVRRELAGLLVRAAANGASVRRRP